MNVICTCLADYAKHHPHVLPSAFSDLRVLAGGVGAGTEVSYRLQIMVQTHDVLVRIEEPEPGRVLTETNSDGGVTTFTVTPELEGVRTRIETALPEAHGLKEMAHRFIAPHLLEPIFKKEFDLLAAYTQKLSTAQAEVPAPDRTSLPE